MGYWDKAHTNVHEAHTSVHEAHTSVHEAHTSIHEVTTLVGGNRLCKPLSGSLDLTLSDYPAGNLEYVQTTS